MLKNLSGKHIILRPLRLSDADDITSYCKDKEFAKTTLRVFHPYHRKDAIGFIKHAFKDRKTKKAYSYAIEHNGKMVGSISIRPEGHKASIGYGIGRAYWGQGITTEALKLIINEGFRTLPLERIYAEHWVKNPASGRVMQKAGMKHEGTLRAHEKKGKTYWDVCVYGILKKEWKRL